MSSFAERQEAMRRARCKHFNGVLNKVCRAGVTYNALSLPALAVCCHNEGECVKRERPTSEELEAENKRFKEAFERVAKARKAIVDLLEASGNKKGEGAAGTTKCPCCGGRLGFSKAGSNGHIHALCSTAGCVSWME